MSGSTTTYSGVVTSVEVPSSFSDYCTSSAQLGFTLTTADSVQIKLGIYLGYNTQAPPIDSLLGKNVQAVVTPRMDTGYSGHSGLELRDENGVILSVDWNMGGTKASSSSLSDAGISVEPATAVCTNSCFVARKIRSTGTTSVELATGEHGTFQAGSVSYTAYAIGCADQATGGRMR